VPPVSAEAWRNDATAKVTGRTRFTADIKVPGLLHAAPVYSDCVHAEIRGLRTAEAEAAPGVVRVLTAADVLGANLSGPIIQDCPVFAADRIRSHGDVVALVVAEDRESAIRAASLVEVVAEELPAVLDPEEALASDAVLVHEGHGTNLVNHHKVRRGNPDEGFAASAFVIEHEFGTQLVEHAYLEPEVALCIPRADGVMEVHASLQHPYSTRRVVAGSLGVKLTEVEVRPAPMGGGFGGKDDTVSNVCARAALAARLLERPVSICYEREWSVRESYKRHPYKARYRLGVGDDGLMKAVEVRMVADSGAYCSVTPWVTWRSTVQCCGPYRVENVHADIYGVYTNNVFTGAMRGFGSPQVNFFVEQLVDMAAERCGISGVEFRRRNMLREGETTVTGQVLEGHTVSTGQVLDEVLEAFDFEAKLERCSFGRSEDDELYGVGLALSYRGMSLGAEGVDFCSAVVDVQFDGSILLESGIHENGQGSEAAMVLVLADELGVDRARIRYRQPSTSTIPDGGPTVASRGTLMGGSAVVDAARKIKRQVAAIVAPELGCDSEQVEFREDRVHGPDGSISFEEAIGHMARNKRHPYAFGSYAGPAVDWREMDGQGRAYFTWVYGCQAIELTVNRRTGKVRLIDAIAAHDVGRAINPEMLRGQFFGGMAMAIGYALHEEVDQVDGRIKNLNLDHYRIPRAKDVPRMQAIIVENPDRHSLSGAKGVAEPTNELMAPAIANAIYRATGVRHSRLPIRVAAPVPVPAPEGAPSHVEVER